MLPNVIENCPAILRINEFSRQCGFRVQDEGERGPVFRAIAIEADFRSNEMPRQQ
jgi:hypothetical protein